MKQWKSIAGILLIPILCFLLTGCDGLTAQPADTSAEGFSLRNIPAYSGKAYVELNNNIPYFEDSEYTTQSFESYGDLDALGRCTAAYACVGIDTMPTEKRGSIGAVKPTGWHTVKYDNVDGSYLYNRCHLIGYQLTAENDNRQNLITGTRYLNVEGMLPFENMVADYVKETRYHVLYRVTPIFQGDHLLADGVEMEAFSVEDSGEGICFHIYAYNVQPGIEIDYATGDSKITDEAAANTKRDYVLNTKNKKFHLPDCRMAEQISEKNKEVKKSTAKELREQGYQACGICISY